MTSEVRGSPLTRAEIEADVLALIPESHQELGITVTAQKVPRTGGEYHVRLHLGEDSELVGGKSLYPTLADWHDGRDGPLPEWVADAADASAQRHSAGRSAK